VKLRRSNSATGAVDLEGDLEGCELTNELEDAVHAAVAAIVTNESDDDLPNVNVV